MGIRTLSVVNIALRMTQGNSVGVIYLGVTAVSTMYRSVLCDEISHNGHLFELCMCVIWLEGVVVVSVKEFVCVFVESEIIRAGSCASAYRASGQVANVLI